MLKLHIDLPHTDEIVPKIMVIIATILLVGGLLALSWGTVILIIKGICWCFKWGFSYRIATGVWLILVLLDGVFSSNKS